MLLDRSAVYGWKTILQKSTGGWGFEYHLRESTGILFYRAFGSLYGDEIASLLETKPDLGRLNRSPIDRVKGVDVESAADESAGKSAVRTNRPPLSYRRLWRKLLQGDGSAMKQNYLSDLRRTGLRCNTQPLEKALVIATMATGHWDNGHWTL